MESLGELPIHAVLPTSDPQRAKDWYREKLGLTPERETPSGDAWYRCGEGTAFFLAYTSNAGTAKNTAAGFSVKELSSVMEWLRGRGVVFEEYDFGEYGKTENGVFSMGGMNIAWFKDSEDNVIQLAETG